MSRRYPGRSYPTTFPKSPKLSLITPLILSGLRRSKTTEETRCKKPSLIAFLKVLITYSTITLKRIKRSMWIAGYTRKVNQPQRTPKTVWTGKLRKRKGQKFSSSLFSMRFSMTQWVKIREDQSLRMSSRRDSTLTLLHQRPSNGTRTLYAHLKVWIKLECVACRTRNRPKRSKVNNWEKMTLKNSL